VASFIRNIHDKNINGAAAGILKQNIRRQLRRVCPTEILCEDACVRNHDAEGQPVKIGLLQRYAVDHMQFEAHHSSARQHGQEDRRRRAAGRPVVRAPPGHAGQRRGDL
jgi:NADPH-dependent glutamate synthase beta subunit-like oxidoreductase